MTCALIGRFLLCAFGVGMLWQTLGGVLALQAGLSASSLAGLPPAAAGLLGSIAMAGEAATRSGVWLLGAGTVGWLAACAVWMGVLARGGTRVQPAGGLRFERSQRWPATR